MNRSDWLKKLDWQCPQDEERRYRTVYISAIAGKGIYHWAWYLSPKAKRVFTTPASSRAEALWFCLADLIDHLPETTDGFRVLVDSLVFSGQAHAVIPIPPKSRWL